MTRVEPAPGSTVWLTGLSGAGKATMSRLVAGELTGRVSAEFGPFVEVYVRASVGECARRDPEGLYRRARAGGLPDFTGVSAPYEVPAAPDLELDTELEEPQPCADRMIALLESRGFLR